jgi:hypothetical protein
MYNNEKSYKKYSISSSTTRNSEGLNNNLIPKQIYYDRKITLFD